MKKHLILALLSISVIVYGTKTLKKSSLDNKNNMFWSCRNAPSKWTINN